MCPGESPVRDSSETTDTRVEDGKLLYERRWFHRGQSVYVEGRDLPKFPGHIHAITDEAVSLSYVTTYSYVGGGKLPCVSLYLCLRISENLKQR